MLAAPADQGYDSPTLTSPAMMTGVGVILGTAAYMSPEQARGKALDKRADIWAFGVVLYEMLTGDALFAGDTITDVLAAVVTKEPQWTRVPAKARRLLESCLEKDPARRLRDIGDAWRLIEDAPLLSAPSRSPLGFIAAGVTTIAVTALAGLAFVHFRETPPPHDVVRLQIPLPIGAQPDLTFTLSPDGRRLALVGTSADGIRRVWLRALDELESRPLAGTENVDNAPMFWSPDSRLLAFAAGGKLKKIDVAGGPAQTVADVAGAGAIGGAWNDAGIIVFGTNASGRPGGGGIFRVSAAGGVPTVLTNLGASRQELGHRHPTFLPDGRHFLYLRTSSTPEKSGIFVASLDAAPADQPSTPLIAATSGPVVFTPSTGTGSQAGKGQLLFLRERTLMAQAFDAQSLALSGEAVPVVEPVGSFLDRGLFTASINGTLVYTTASTVLDRQLTWFDRETGKALGTVGEPGPYNSVTLSPDARRAAVVRTEYGTGLQRDVWLFDFTRGTQTRFTFGPGRGRSPVWSPDGSRIVFASDLGDGSTLYEKPANGAKDAQALLKALNITPTSWSHDGRFLLYTVSQPKTRLDLWVLPMDGERKPFPFLQTEASERDAELSPDGQWVAYTSDESGRDDVYVRAFSPTPAGTVAGGKWLISRDGGSAPRWLKNGRELTYVSPRRESQVGGIVMVVDVFPGSGFQSGAPRSLLSANVGAVFGDATADGKRLLGGIPTEKSAAPPPFNVVLNWQAGLKK